MPREVNTVLSVCDANGNNVKTLVISKMSVTNENSRFLIKQMCIQTKPTPELIESFIKDLLIYDLIFKNCDMTELASYIPNFDSFMDCFNDLIESMMNEYPNRFDKVARTLDDSTIYKSIDVNIYGGLKELDYKQVTYLLDTPNCVYNLQSYPLIKEYADRIYQSCINFEDLTSTQNKLIIIHSSLIFFELMLKETKDEKYKKMIEDVNEVLDELLEESDEAEEYNELLSNNLTYQVFDTVSPCNDIYMFGSFVMNNLISSKRLDIIDELRYALLKLKPKEPDYKAVADEISKVFLSNDLVDENTYYQKIRKASSDMDVTEALLLVVASWVVKEEYIKLVEELNGEARKPKNQDS